MAINQNIFIHEDDKAALKALESIPGFSQVMKMFMKSFNEKIMYIDNMSSNILISDEQLPKYKQMLIPICEKLDIDVPDLFLKRDVNPNAYTSGEEKPFIVMTSGLLDVIPEDLIPTVLAHECGHIVCHHVLYRTMGQMILNGALLSVLNPAIRGLLTYPIVSAFAYWMRCSEYSADRAAILCDGSADKITRLCMHFAGFDKDLINEMNVEAFMRQADEYRNEIKENKKSKTMEFMLYSNRSHPLNAIRAAEAYEWSKSEDYHNACDYFVSYRHQVPKNIPLGFNLKSLVGKNMNDVEKQFRDLGLNNISFDRTTDKNVFYKENAVTNILVNDVNDYKDGQWIDKDSNIVISYYKPYSEQELNALHPTQVKFPKASSYYIGKNYKEVEMDLFNSGIINTNLIPVYDVDNLSRNLLNKVLMIKVNDNNKLNKGDWINVLDEVNIYYHELSDKKI